MFISTHICLTNDYRDVLSKHKRRRNRSRSQGRSQSRSRSCTRSRSGSRRHYRRQKKRKRRRRHRHRRKRRRCQKCQDIPKICHVDICPPTNLCPSNPIWKFPFRDALIIAMTIFFSYWMQRTASQMQFPTPPEAPIHLT